MLYTRSEAPYCPHLYLKRAMEDVAGSEQVLRAQLTSMQIRVDRVRTLPEWKKNLWIFWVGPLLEVGWENVARDEKSHRALLAEYAALKARLKEFDTHYPTLGITRVAELKYSTEDPEVRMRAARLFNGLASFYDQRSTERGGVFVPSLGDYWDAERAVEACKKFDDAYDGKITAIQELPFPGKDLLGKNN